MNPLANVSTFTKATPFCLPLCISLVILGWPPNDQKGAFDLTRMLAQDLKRQYSLT